MPVEHFNRLRVAFHAPVVDGVVGYECYSVEGDPLPERHVVGHGVRLHLALHFNVENLEGFRGWKSENGAGLNKFAGASDDHKVVFSVKHTTQTNEVFKMLRDIGKVQTA